MVKDFLGWWGRNLRLALGGGAVPGAAGAAPALLLAAAGAGLVEVALRRGGVVQVLGRFGADAAGRAALTAALGGRAVPGQVVLCAAPGALLERPLELPLAAEGSLRDVLRFEIERLTPFSAAEVAWHWRVERRDKARGKLGLVLGVVPLAAVAPLRVATEAMGLEPVALEVPGADGVPRRLALTEAEVAAPRARRALAWGCAALALLAVALPFVRQWQAEAALDARLAELRAPMAEVEALRRRLAQGSASADVIARERLRLGSLLQPLAVLTETLPDDSFLVELSLTGGQVLMSGQSSAAARLLGALAAAPGLRNPAFVAPVRRTEDGRADLFSLRVEWAP